MTLAVKKKYFKGYYANCFKVLVSINRIHINYFLKLIYYFSVILDW